MTNAHDSNKQFDLDELLHPAQAFDHPRDVVNDADLTLGEKRAILASWASDACAVEAGSKGLTGSKAPDAAKDDKSKDTKAAAAPKKGGFGIGGLKQTVAPEKQSAQVSASGGSRGLGPDRAAKGGGNPAMVKVGAISDWELAAFQKALA